MKEYISVVLENNLVVSRLVLDHAIILLSFVLFNDNELQNLIEDEQKKYADLLLLVISQSYDKVSRKFLEGNILLTEYTVLMEQKSCRLYKVKEEKEVNLKCLDLIINSKEPYDYNFQDHEKIKKINYQLLEQLKNSKIILERLQKNIDEEISILYFSSNYIEHLINETEIFIYTIDFLNRMMTFTPTYVYKCEYYYNVFMKEHAEYLENMVSPININNPELFQYYVTDFQKIIDVFDNEISPNVISGINKRTKKASTNFIDYNLTILKNIVHSKYYASSIPLLNDHILRESNYMNYQLETFNFLSN